MTDPTDPLDSTRVRVGCGILALLVYIVLVVLMAWLGQAG